MNPLTLEEFARGWKLDDCDHVFTHGLNKWFFPVCTGEYLTNYYTGVRSPDHVFIHPRFLARNTMLDVYRDYLKTFAKEHPEWSV